MRPEKKSQLLLGVTRSKAKMFEYGVPDEHHIHITQPPAKLLAITIGMLGDLAAAINRGGLTPQILSELKIEVIFSARFFDSYTKTKLSEELDPYLMLLGSASYYLCDLPGSATVLANQATALKPEEDPYAMGRFLRYLLAPEKFTPPDNPANKIDEYFFDRYSLIANDYKYLFVGSPLNGFNFEFIKERIIGWAKDIRDVSYKIGGARQLLFADIIAAIVITKIKNSAWACLPKYSGLNLDVWYSTIAKQGAIKEFWPAQHLLGHANVLNGKSAIVQMPTSAGKTKATELILRSAFLADRVALAIIIAPFRALCHEIKNTLVEAFQNESTKVDELSDAMQTDFELAELLGHQQILVVTPEKLL